MAARTGAAIVEDDYDGEFRHTARPLEPLQRLDRDGRVVYVGTFSETLSPALRARFLAVPKPLVPVMLAVLAARVALADPRSPPYARRSTGAHRRRRRWRSRRWSPTGTSTATCAGPARCTGSGAGWSGRQSAGSFPPAAGRGGLHLTVVGSDVPADDRLWPAMAVHTLRIGSLGACPTGWWVPAVRALAAALEQAEQAEERR